jgi:hypothetical protein
MEPSTSESSEPPVIYPNLKQFNKANPVPAVAAEGYFSVFVVSSMEKLYKLKVIDFI